MDHEILNRLLSLSVASCYNHTFTCRQSISLDYNRRLRVAEFSTSKTLDCVFGRLSYTKRSRRYPVPRHEVLRKDLASLKSCGSSSGSNDRQPLFNEQVHNSIGEPRFGAHKCKVNLICFNKRR